MALLFYSDRCSHCKEFVQWLEKHPQINKIVKRHNVTVNGVPPKFKSSVKSVPTLITQQGGVMIGSQCLAWANSLVPPADIEGVGGGWGTSLTEPNAYDGMFSLDSYGQSIQPQITPEMEAKINSTVTDAYQSMQTAIKE